MIITIYNNNDNKNDNDDDDDDDGNRQSKIGSGSLFLTYSTPLHTKPCFFCFKYII